MSDCIFCKIINKQLPTDFIYEDSETVVFKDIQPKAPVHVLVVPKKHIASLAELTSPDQAVMANMMMNLASIAKKAGLNDGFRTIINTGQGGGQEIDHLHVHILGGRPLPGF
ncbi:HIT-like protein [Piscirickettsia salmonis]|uniref:HIT domain protein n=1 Tax=Piscirickettsia salmonis TaxID=1238 RepID=A0A1L6TEQ8_PISSA|nr:histidine triad nucleotide-binding protein [Piscirickettsia salmonis]ALB23963.1 HIT domain protein [Piscirickettsia salmonis]ALT18694.1 histidine triad nucleotide-binding protein [Piscirickettsia salmonis LF-89 = ATCC VR-1361]ALY03785.1 histidine triad nucleotide-binding protein [Piscirickettsia salmonis]AMA43347.1 histidine triad nucleotide-binding protein [Piscirickettsia salmonis]AOS35817.1 histidine triad nucleotide-binding protein [Piscirickettsia salmonis]